MTYRGTVRQGVVVLEGGVSLEEGTAVEVQPLPVGARATPQASGTIWDKLRKLAGSAPGLPPDAAINHDHYLYGTPKQSRTNGETPDGETSHR